MRFLMAEESYLRLNTPNSPLHEFCNNALHMNKISRSLLCHLLPTLKFPFSRNRGNHKYIKSSGFDAMQSQTLIDGFAKNNQDFHRPNLELHDLSRFHIPQTFPFLQQNHSPEVSEQSADVSATEFKSISPFASNSQILKPVSNSFETNTKSTSSIISTNLQRGNSKVFSNPLPDLNKEQSYHSSLIDYRPLTSRQYWSPNDKKVPNNNRDETISLKADTETHQNFRPSSLSSKKNIAVDNRENWTPISYSKNLNHLPQSYTTKYRGRKPITFSPRIPVYNPTRTPTTSRPKKNDYFRRDYLIDTKDPSIINYEGIQRNNKIDIKSIKNPKYRLRLPVIEKDFSNPTTLVNEAMNTYITETTTPMTSAPMTSTPITSTETGFILSVRKEHSDYTKSSVVYTVNDSAHEQTNQSIKSDQKLISNHMNDTEPKENTEEIDEMSDHSNKDIKTESVQPSVDFPMFSSLTTSNFSCTNSGFYADKDFGCQVYHHCGQDYHQKFICPNGTLFNDRIQACDYWFNVNCELITKSVKISYDVKEEMNVLADTSRPSFQKQINSDNNQTIPKLMESLRIFAEDVEDMNRTQVESDVDKHYIE